MEVLKNWKLIIVLFLSVLTIQSCNKDDDAAPVVKTEDTNEEGNETSETGEISITLYKINKSQIIKVKDYDVKGENLDYQKDVNRHQEIWRLVKKVVPPTYLSKMTEFLIFAGEKPGVFAYVEPNENLSLWKMAIAIDLAESEGEEELKATVIHEFGHILTLDNTQLDTDSNLASCSN